MNIKVTIELEGPETEVQAWLARAGMLQRETSKDLVLALDAKEQDTYSDVSADKLVRRITPLARQALEEIALEAPEVSFDDLQGALGMDGTQLGGVMASFGFAERAGLPRPFKVDRSGRRYLIDRTTASAVLDALRRFQPR